MPAGRRKPAGPPGVTRLELARMLGCNPQTICKWQEEGLPVQARGRGGRASRYDPEACAEWLKARNAAETSADGLSPSQEKARREHWQALVAEQTYRQRAGELLPRDEVLKVWSAQCGAIRSRLLAWATTIADRVHRAGTLEGLPGVERELGRAAREVLAELAGEAEDGEAGEPPKGKRRRKAVA